MVAVLSARGKHTDELVAARPRGLPAAAPARDGHAALDRRARDLRARGDGDQRPRPRGDLADRLAGRASSPTAVTPRPRSSRSRPTASARRSTTGKVVLVAGFQGVSQGSLDVTTLGRGGSDTTAVALAAALGAEVCEIFTDVAGVFSADPRIVPEARKLPVLTFEEMLEMAASGAGVLQLRSVEYARNHGVTIHCRSSFEEGTGTVIQDEEMTMERPLVTAVTHSTSEARITLARPARPAGHRRPRVLGALAEANVNVDMIIQNEPASEGHLADMSFTVPRDDLVSAREALEPLKDELGFAAIQTDEQMGKVSVVGAGMKSHPGVAAQDLRGDRQRRGEHRDDLHLADQDLVRRARGARGDRGARAARGLRARRRRRAARGRGRRPPAQGQLVRVAVVGATGAVGSTILGVMRERAFPADEVVPFASERSAGRTIDYGDRDLTVVALSDEAIQGFDLALFSAGSAISAEWAPQVRRRRARSWSTTRRSGACTTTCRWSSPRSTRRRSTATAASSPTPTARRCRRSWRSSPILEAAGIERRGDVELPGGVGHRPAGGRGAAPAGGGRDRGARSCRRRRSTRTRSRSTCCPRSRPSRTATTTRPRSASACARRARSSAATTSACRPPARACRSSRGTRCRPTCRRATRCRPTSAASCSPAPPA